MTTELAYSMLILPVIVTLTVCIDFVESLWKLVNGKKNKTDGVWTMVC